jgi:hypothetical protein
MDAQDYAPSAWLQLSQLHTLRGVDLSIVSMAAIAAALPRLHTLGVDIIPDVPAAAVGGFFDDLLPRLQVFESVGWWPQDLLSQEVAASTRAPPQPLPQLRTLKLRGFGRYPASWTQFMGARPLVLSIAEAMIEHWLPSDDGGDGGAVFSPFASVRTLCITDVQSAIVFTPTNVARILRASPNVETLTVSADVDIDASWLAHSGHHPALGELVHSNLRRIRCFGESFSAVLRPDFTRLRRRPHFPRLKCVNFSGHEYFITPLESLVDCTSSPASGNFVETVLQ